MIFVHHDTVIDRWDSVDHVVPTLRNPSRIIAVSILVSRKVRIAGVAIFLGSGRVGEILGADF